MEVQGLWTGTITYGEKYKEYKNKELYFDLEILQEKNKITGNAIDIGGIGMSPDAARIIGTRQGKKIKFVKQYGSLHYYDKGHTKVDKSKSGKEIDYAGEYNDETQTFYGNWFIRERVYLFGIIPMNYILAGTWTMRRK